MRPKGPPRLLAVRIDSWWWLIMFTLFCFVVYEQTARQQGKQLSALRSQVNLLESEIARSQGIQQELKIEIDSLNEPTWIEMILKKKLGLVHQNQRKVYFHSD